MIDIQEQLGMIIKESQVNNRANGMEFKRIAGALQKMGNLVDLLYLEIAVLLDVLSKKGMLTEKEFAEQLEETSKKIAEHVEKAKEGKKDEDNTPPSPSDTVIKK